MARGTVSSSILLKDVVIESKVLKSQMIVETKMILKVINNDADCMDRTGVAGVAKDKEH